MDATLTNRFVSQTRRFAGRIDVQLSGGAVIGCWRAGYTNVGGGGSFVSAWQQEIPALSSLVGENRFTLTAEDVTPAPWNQPPYPPAGDTATDGCVLTGRLP
jgi:hypothetical protein